MPRATSCLVTTAGVQMTPRGRAAGLGAAVLRAAVGLAVLGTAGLGVVGLAVVTAAPAFAGTRPVTGWGWPMAGPPAVVRGFDPPATPYGPGHRGVDLAGQPGMTVRAAGAGIVGYAGLIAGRGVISVRHSGGLRTTYEPVTSLVHSGQRVALGQPIGELSGGHPGCSRPACLHWGLLRGETYLDPLSLLGVGRVRLLPLSGRSWAAGGPLAGGRPALRQPGQARPALRRTVQGQGWVPAGAGLVATATWLRLGRHRAAGRRRAPAAAASARPGLSAAGRPSSSAAGSLPWCASGRSGFP